MTKRIFTMTLVIEKALIAKRREDLTKKKREDLGLPKTEEGPLKK